MVNQSWEAFRQSLSEIRTLLKAAEDAPVLVPIGASVSPRQVYVRAAIVLFAAHVEAFFRALPLEYTDQIPQHSWGAQRPGVQRFLALQVVRRLETQFAQAGDCADKNKREAVRRCVVSTARWFAKPWRVGESQDRPRLTEFYRQRGASAIEKLLEEFHPEAMPFFTWLSSRKFDRSRFWTVIQGLIEARNTIAHGDSQFSLTLGEARQYVAVTTVLLRQVRVYLA